jgi:hypothetical protein
LFNAQAYTDAGFLKDVILCGNKHVDVVKRLFQCSRYLVVPLLKVFLEQGRILCTFPDGVRNSDLSACFCTLYK